MNEAKQKTHAVPVLAGIYQNEPSVPGLSLRDDEFVGFNGRCNKSVDTCYAYWVTASLDVNTIRLHKTCDNCAN